MIHFFPTWIKYIFLHNKLFIDHGRTGGEGLILNTNVSVVFCLWSWLPLGKYKRNDNNNWPFLKFRYLTPFPRDHLKPYHRFQNSVRWNNILISISRPCKIPAKKRTIQFRVNVTAQSTNEFNIGEWWLVCENLGFYNIGMRLISEILRFGTLRPTWVHRVKRLLNLSSPLLYDFADTKVYNLQ